MFFADLHVHSRFSRATSRECDAPHMDMWARRKGIALLGTGDFTHAAWRGELREHLEEAEPGLYRLKEEYRVSDSAAGEQAAPRFVLSGEISTIYKQDGRTRKVHHVILLPSLEDADRLSARLSQVGNIHSDGRPILGLDSRTLLEIALEACPECVFIPAHIWTPHFSVFGAFSGFETLEECYGDLAGHIHALETGLSSDPPMNRRLSMLDGYQLVSNSDAHSPARLGREANMLECEMSYAGLKRALETGEGLTGTVEFFPEEGKYHLDGHRNCKCCLEPSQTIRAGGKCPVCGRKVTVGVLHRVEEMADRPENACTPPHFESLMPLNEVVGNCMGVSAESKKAQAVYKRMLESFGSEFFILREMDAEQAARENDSSGTFRAIAEGLTRLRQGRVIRQAGYDGEYGKIALFAPGELAQFQGQMSFALGKAEIPKEDAREAESMPVSGKERQTGAPEGLNAEQAACVLSDAARLAVVAGPGTGKTRTLIARIERMIQSGVKPQDIAAVTFTRQAAGELRTRLEERLGKRAVKGMQVGTFHSICLGLIEEKPLLDPSQAAQVAGAIAPDRPAAETLSAISRAKTQPGEEGPEGLLAAYQAELDALGVRDMDDILLEGLRASAPARHLLVDECQDINAVQRQLMEKWSAEGESLFAIGDPDQSIYGFRGASAACFAELKNAFEDLQILRLRENYRSTPEILSLARGIIEKNPGGGREMIARQGAGEPVVCAKAPDGHGEGAWIAEQISRMVGGMDMHEARSDGTARAFSDIAVLCRTHRQLETMEASLRRKDIPCQVYGAQDILSDAAVQGAIAILRCLSEETKRDSLLYGSCQVRAMAVPNGQEAMEALRDRGKEAPKKQMEALMKITGLKTPALEQMAAVAAGFRSAEDFLRALTEGEENGIRRLSGVRKASGAVQLMTLHAAKGLEFPVVFLAGMEEGAFPLRRQGKVEDPEEERRLLFVGVTRAKEELILTCGGEPSEFFREMPDPVTIRPRIRAEQLSIF